MNTPCIETIEFHGLEALRLTGPRGASAIVSRLGGQVLSWVTADGREHLFLSEKAVFDGSLPIRGGVPVCFPQFAGQGDLPKHGLVRTRLWDVSARRSGDDYALATLTLEDDEASRALWPHPFKLELTLMLEADRLDLELCVINTGEAPFEFTGALHTYLRVVQVEDVTIDGLAGFEYRDAANGNQVQRETTEELMIEAETDRVYRNVDQPQVLRAGNLSLGIQIRDFPDVVVWNPWVEKCASLADMPADAWRHMLCVEAAVADSRIVLPAGEEWYGRQALVLA